MVDITIRGAGIFGLSIAWVCVCRGAKVQIIDPNGPGAGSSGGLVGALAPHVPENWNPKKAFQLDSLLMAKEFWAQVARAKRAKPRIHPQRSIATSPRRCFLFPGAATGRNGQDTLAGTGDMDC